MEDTVLSPWPPSSLEAMSLQLGASLCTVAPVLHPVIYVTDDLG